MASFNLSAAEVIFNQLEFVFLQGELGDFGIYGLFGEPVWYWFLVARDLAFSGGDGGHGAWSLPYWTSVLVTSMEV